MKRKFAHQRCLRNEYELVEEREKPSNNVQRSATGVLMNSCVNTTGDDGDDDENSDDNDNKAEQRIRKR